MMQPPKNNPTWDPQQYQRFSDNRLRPGLDLLARVPLSTPRVIYDLGCGPGQLTRILAAKWPAAAVYGVDNSQPMLDEARKVSSSVSWINHDIQSWNPGTAPDLIISNATLQWLGDHETLFPHLLRALSRGGCLAVQMPANFDAPSHALMKEVLLSCGFGSEKLKSFLANRAVREAGSYYDLLAPHAATVDIWSTEYLHLLSGPDPVLEWVKGTGLRPVLEDLSESEREVFLDQYRARLRTAYPARTDGTVPFPFRRLFMTALAK